MKKIYLVPVVLLTVVLAGCATVPTKPTPTQRTDVIDAPFDKVWEALVTTLSDEGFTFELIEKDSGVINTKMVTFASGPFADLRIERVAKHPLIFGGNWSEGRYAFSILVTPISENVTQIKVTINCEAYENEKTNRWHACESKGVVEKRLFELVRSKV